MAWKDLNIRQKADLMGLMIRNGVSSVPEMADIYNSVYVHKDGGSIHIKPSKRGTFTAAAEKRGKSVQAFASQVLANKENYSPAMVKKAVFAHNAKSWKHDDGGYNWTPDNPVPEVYPLEINPEFKLSASSNPYTFDDFKAALLTPERRLQWKIQGFSGYSDEDLRYLYERIPDAGWDPRVTAHALDSETGFNPYNNSKVSSAVGLAQLTKDELKRMYPDTYKEVHQAYVNKERSIRDNIDDFVSHYKYLHDRISTELDNMGYGRLKVNLLAKNAALDSPVSEAVWKNSLTKSQKKLITPGVSTYRDLMKMYDAEFNQRNK